jgi:hypothetical protein
VDFPRIAGPIANRAQEDASGKSRAFLADYSPEELINWSYDCDGQLEWVTVRTSWLRQASVSSESWQKETRWIHYDRETFKTFRSVQEPGGRSGGIDLVDEGRHALASQSKVPLFELRVSDGLWLMNKAALLQLEHFNKSNALSWALTMGLFATPVIYSEREWSQIVGESYYIQLGPQDRFGWTEPEGHVFQIAADNLERLKDEIYRVCYLMVQAGGTSSSHVSQPGLSKQRDFSVTQEVLRAYGDAVKHTMKQVLRAIEAARQDGLSIDVSGRGCRFTTRTPRVRSRQLTGTPCTFSRIATFHRRSIPTKRCSCPMQMGFARAKSSHLVGITGYTTPWQKEVTRSVGANLESVVLFALDQFCLMSCPVPLPAGARRSLYIE